MPKVSIIIPVYNVEKYIRQALDSVISQTLKDIEIICINDCTPDKSFEIVKEYAENDARFVLFEMESNQGQGIARNRALDIAQGDYIMFLDPDDWLELDACEKAYNQIHKNQNDVVFFNLYEYKKNKQKLNKNRLKYFQNYLENTNINLKEIKQNWINSCWVWAQIYSTNFLKNNKILFSEERFAEDLAFFIKAITSSNSISILDKPLYNYRQNTSSTIDYSKFFEAILSTKQEAYKIIIESENNNNILKNYIEYWIKSDLYWLKRFCKNNKKIKNIFYSQIKSNFEKIKKDNEDFIDKNSSAYRELNLFLKSNSYREYRFKKLLYKIFK